jgi:predicted enzyme related to lactoylglutathione lyase
MPTQVVETFFSIAVRDMERATNFYVTAFGATVAFALPFWSSLHVASVRLGLALVPEHAGGTTGLHFGVVDLADARAWIERAGGRIVRASVEVAPGVVVSDVEDTEGNGFALVQR